jgi:hypothetical protein
MRGTSTHAAGDTFLRSCAILDPGGWEDRRDVLTRLDAPGWERVGTLAADHGVVGLVARSLAWASERFGIDIPILDRMAAARRDLLVEMMFRRNAARQAGEAFAARNLQFVIYKGAVLSEEVYGDLSLRAFGDCDVLLRPDQLAAAHDALRELGYSLPGHVRLDDLVSARYDPGARHEITMYHPRGLVVDLHRSPFGQELMPKDLEAIWRCCGPPRWPTFLPGWRYSPELTLINSATHFYAHSFRELKPLIDFYVTAVKWGDRIDLERLFSTARTIGVLPMMDIAARLCERMLAPHPLVRRIAAGSPSLRARMACAALPRRLLERRTAGEAERVFPARRLLYCGTLSSFGRATRISLLPSAQQLELRFRRPFHVFMYPRYYLLQLYRALSRPKEPFRAFVGASRRASAGPNRRP